MTLPPAAPARPKILVVDDNEQNLALAEATLAQEDCYEVVLASSGEEALAAFARDCPACVLVDVRMPGMDGFTLCERIRALPEGRDVPIIFLTALRDVDTFEHALRSGGDDFLTKPVRPIELVARVNTALKLRRIDQNLREHLQLVRSQRDDLMRLQLQKERLTSFVVHDLKNPLNSIGLALQSLLRTEDLPPRAQRAARTIQIASRQMQGLILNLLDVSKAEEGQLVPRLTEVDLGALFGELVAEVGTGDQDLQVRSRIDFAPPHVRADGDLLRRVLENLVDNAIKHTPEGSRIAISATLDGTDVEIRVSDEGPGVPPELREKIFERYVQVEADPEAGSRSGQGLGLHFCQLALAAHGGSIKLEDGPGCTFCLRLPREP